ncbi:hypothetical protein BDP55DRAFT_632664 [Colletotrichum godetiae]|uniref:Uncharacterized protein n=1 Tax=Colletotrichum godetiae TaxID=1209918 RepID=A0AAJ0AJH2_9PEZI|nr:uncharacterized protein BDP55DRAFT_632664 [Colletotrichum godetiae]KAK1675027.1 hypothetical protein BDP55DRAFT_632664 [Colletotrichum godetiae]
METDICATPIKLLADPAVASIAHRRSIRRDTVPLQKAQVPWSVDASEAENMGYQDCAPPHFTRVHLCEIPYPPIIVLVTTRPLQKSFHLVIPGQDPTDSVRHDLSVLPQIGEYGGHIPLETEIIDVLDLSQSNHDTRPQTNPSEPPTRPVPSAAGLNGAAPDMKKWRQSTSPSGAYSPAEPKLSGPLASGN